MFETLPPRRGHEDYYKAVRMPISLQDAEAKLKAGKFKTLTELESYMKRMVLNVREYYGKNSPQVDDSERVRKATSNFMVKHNPAYKLNQGYTAFPTPFPDEEDADAAADADGDEDAEGEEDDAEGEAEDDEERDEEEEDDEDEDDEDEDEDDVKTPGRRKSSSNRSVSMRDTPVRNSRKSSERTVAPGLKQDHDFDGVPYKGLTFQEAQEKIVEEIIRRPDEE